ncbi:Flagellar hook-length control protein, partial [mine drainage metagenome]
GSGAWTEQLAARLTWMTQQGVQSASLQLSPRNLGPLQVSISVQHGQASVWFGAAQPETRQALARALPELRNLFANQGLALTDSGVSHDAPRQSRAGTGSAATTLGEASGSQSDVGGAAALRGAGLIDTYA